MKLNILIIVLIVVGVASPSFAEKSDWEAKSKPTTEQREAEREAREEKREARREQREAEKEAREEEIKGRKER